MRYEGIDILRILAMGFIVVLHLLGHGGVLSAVEDSSIEFKIAYFFETVCYCGVAIFGIITGFVCYSTKVKKRRWEKFIGLWVEVVFYNLIITFLCFYLTNSAFRVNDIIKCFFPIAERTYWYFTSYFLLFLCMPSINHNICHNDEKKDISLLFALTMLLYYSHKITGMFALAMLLQLYVVGALLKKYDIASKTRYKQIIIVYLIMLLTTYTYTILVKPINNSLGGLLLRYDSPLIISMGICITLLFIKFKNIPFIMRYISKFGVNAFAVYLINDNPLFRTVFIKDRFSDIAINSLELVYVVMLFSIFFTALSIVVDRWRNALFSIIGIELLVKVVCDYKDKTIDTLYKYILGNKNIKER